MATYLQADRPLSVTTPLGADKLLLTGFTGREGISELFHFQLDMMAENAEDIAFDKLLGQKVTAKVQVASRNTRFFSGIVSRISQSGRDQTFTGYRAEVVPQFWLLTKRQQSRIFQYLSIPDILKQVLAGMDVTYEIQGTFHPREYCVQYRESDFAFASRLMEEEGIYYFFKHASSGHTMVLANTPQSHPDSSPAKVIYEELTGGNRPEGRVLQWERTQELRSGKATLWDHSFELPGKHLEAEKAIVDTVQAGTVAHKFKIANNDKLEIYDFPGGYAQRFDGVNRGGGDQPAELQKIFTDNARTVDLRMQAEAAGGILIRGSSNCAHFTSGHRFTLEEHFNANGLYVLTSVQHDARLEGDYRSGEEFDIRYQNDFTCIPAALPFRPARMTPIPHVLGSHSGTVVGPAGEEIFTDKYGRIKVQFQWDRQGKNDGNSSCWLRVATPWAGKQWGMIHIPRIGQEVIVGFMNGDVNDPYVIGSVWNGDQMPPYALPANKTQSGIKSRSTLNGAAANFNEIRFEDKKGSEDIFMHAEKDMHVEVENNQEISVGTEKKDKGDRTTTVFNNDTLTVGVGGCTDGSRTATVKKNDTLTVKEGNRTATIEMGNDSLTIKMGNSATKIDLGKSETEAMQSIELKVGQSSVKLDQTGVTIKGLMIKVEGQTMVDVKGLMTTVKADAMMTVKGAITMIN